MAKKKIVQAKTIRMRLSPVRKYLLIFLILCIILFGLFLLKPNKVNDYSHIQEISYSEKNNNTSGWKEYVSQNKTFSFKYPRDLTYAIFSSIDSTDNIFYRPTFYKTEKDAKYATDCVTGSRGTLQNECNTGLFDVTDVTHFKELEKNSLQESLKDASNVNKFYIYSDPKGRKWVVRKPIYTLGETETNIETVDNKKYHIRIHIRDEFIDATLADSEEKQINFVNSLISTFTFNY